MHTNLSFEVYMYIYMNINFAGLLDTLVNLAELHIDIDINSCYPGTCISKL